MVPPHGSFSSSAFAYGPSQLGMPGDVTSWSSDSGSLPVSMRNWSILPASVTSWVSVMRTLARSWPPMMRLVISASTEPISTITIISSIRLMPRAAWRDIGVRRMGRPIWSW